MIGLVTTVNVTWRCWTSRIHSRRRQWRRPAAWVLLTAPNADPVIVVRYVLFMPRFHLFLFLFLTVVPLDRVFSNIRHFEKSFPSVETIAEMRRHNFYFGGNDSVTWRVFLNRKQITKTDPNNRMTGVMWNATHSSLVMATYHEWPSFISYPTCNETNCGIVFRTG